MRTRCNRDIIFRDINTDTQALGVDIREMMFGLFRIFMGNIQAYMVDGMDLHLVIDGTCYDITRCQTQTRVIFLHEIFAIRQTKDTTVTTHGLCDQIRRVGLSGIIKTRRVELYELHAFHFAFGSIDHGDTVSGSNLGVRRGGIDRTSSTGSHERDTAEVGVDLLGFGIQDIRSVALDIRCTTGHTNTQMMLRDDLYGKMVLQYLDIGVVTYRFHQSALDLGTGVIGMVQDTELRVTSFAVQVKLSVLFLVEVNAPVDQFLYAFWCIANHLLYGCRVA